MTSPAPMHSLPIPQSLQSVLDARYEALASAGGYTPRTHHLDSKGRPHFTNRLIEESSPYLLQHAHNPVNWYPWGKDALAAAKAEQKPVFISIGYATCHWCHVMERESFENLEIARFLNQHFISIKVDREQRPDLDDIYMIASQLISKHGGWPLNALLTPEGKPFFAATYFPPAQFLGLLKEAKNTWQDEQPALLAQAERIHTTIEASMAPREASDLPQQTDIQAALDHFLNQYDEFNGGFGNAPKFPQETVLLLLLEQAVMQRDDSLLGYVIHTLDAMQQGGIYDQIGGGFHRYATDPEWLTPHFEKMLYNQALLGDVYLRGYQLTGNPLYRRTLTQTLDYVLREMQAPEGGFYSATDADSEGVEGKFFIWSEEELTQTLTQEQVKLAHTLFDISATGNFEGENILHLPASLPEVAEETGISYGDLLTHTDQLRDQLYKARLQRPAPALDDKIITNWNGLMIRTLAQAGSTLHEPRYLAAAWQAGEFLWQHQGAATKALARDTRAGITGAKGTQEDFAALGRAFIALYDSSGDRLWLDRATTIGRQMMDLFWDNTHGGFFQSQASALSPLRGRSLDDGATPSGTSLGYNLLRELAARTGNSEWQQTADQLMQQLSSRIKQFPARFSYLLADYGKQLHGERSSLQYGANGALKAEVTHDAGHVHVQLTLQDGWHINAHDPGNAKLIGLSLKSEQLSNPSYPQGEALQVLFSDTPISVLSGEIKITGQITETATSLPPLVNLRYQACSDQICLPPETLILQVPAAR